MGSNEPEIITKQPVQATEKLFEKYTWKKE